MLTAGLTGLVLWASGCLSERPRPGPPALQIVFDQTSVHSPDTLTGHILASDADGLDSVWLTVDSSAAAADAFLQTTYGATFRLRVGAGHTTGQHVPVRLQARDLLGFLGTLDTSVVVAP